jgi:gamma-glutamyltranspeptidase
VDCRYSSFAVVILTTTSQPPSLDFGNPGSPDYFGLKPSEANFIKPGKKPLSSMSPTMVFQVRQDTDDNSLGDLRMVVGGSGGPKIISAVFQVITNHLLLGRSLFESVVHPRIHNQLIYHGASATNTENSIAGPLPGVNLEVSNRTKTALEKRGNLLVDIDYAGTVRYFVVRPQYFLITVSITFFAGV